MEELATFITQRRHTGAVVGPRTQCLLHPHERHRGWAVSACQVTQRWIRTAVTCILQPML